MCLPVKPYKIEREWEHEGLKCAVVQAREAGHRCGYVRVPPTHSLHGKDYDDVNVDVHGGLTFAQKEPCTHEDGTGWWFGFDFAHWGDASHDPFIALEDVSEENRRFLASHRKFERDWAADHPEYRPEPEHFWTQAEAESETESLARQLASMSQVVAG